MRSFCRSTLVSSIVILVLLGGCQSGGTIGVSHPLVHTRGRLVEERVREDAWLRSQLAQTENLEPVFSGYHDWRQFVGLYSETKAAFDPSLGQANTLQQQNDRTQQLTYQTQLKRDLLREQEALRRDQEAIATAREKAAREPNSAPPATGESGSSTTSAPVPGKLTHATLPTGSAAFGTGMSELPGVPDSSSPAQTKTQFSFVDKFNARLAARTLVNAAIRANNLDDSHDASGLELYELTLHTSLVPSDNSSDLAQVTLEIMPRTPEERVEDMRRLFALWQDSLQAHLTAQVAEIQYQVREGHVDLPTRQLLEWFLARRLVALDLQLKQEKDDVRAVYKRLRTLLVQLKQDHDQGSKPSDPSQKGSAQASVPREPVKVADFYDLLNEATKRRLYHLLSSDVEKAVRDVLSAPELRDQVLKVASQYDMDGRLSAHAHEQIHANILDRPVLELVRDQGQRERVYRLLTTAGCRIAGGMDWYTGGSESYGKNLATVLNVTKGTTAPDANLPADPDVFEAYRDFRREYEHLNATKPGSIIFDTDNRVDPDYRPFLMQAAAWAIWSQYVDQLRRFVYVTWPDFGKKKGARRTEAESTLQDGFNPRDVASFTDNAKLARVLDRHAIPVLRESSVGSTGYAAFFDRLYELEQQPFALTIQPKQEVQLVSEAAARETVLNLILALNAGLPTSGVEASTQNQLLNRVRDISQGITRQPLLVGFGCGQRCFGWVMGPQFEIHKGESRYRHSPARYDCAAGIVVPGWWSYIGLRGRTAWVDRATGAPYGEKPLWNGQTERLPLRMPSAGLAAITDALMSNHPSTEPSAYATRPVPRLDKKMRGQVEPQTLLATRPGEKALSDQTLLLLGTDLWRSPQVFVGSYRATRVEVLPSMEGLLAYFDALPVPEARFEKAPPTGLPMTVRVVTAFGSDQATDHVLVLPPPKAAAAKPATSAKLISTFVDDKSKDLEFEFEKPASFAKLFVRYRPPAKPVTVTDCPSQPQWGKDNRVLFTFDPLAEKSAPEVLEANLCLLLRPDAGLVPTEVMPTYQKFARFVTAAERSFTLTKPNAANPLEYNENGALPPGTAIVAEYKKSLSEVLEVAYPGLAEAVRQKTLRLEFVEEKGEKKAAKVEIGPGDGDLIQLTVSAEPGSLLSDSEFRSWVRGGADNTRSLKLQFTYESGEQRKPVIIPVVDKDKEGRRVSLTFKVKSAQRIPATVGNPNISFTYQGDMQSELVFKITPEMSGTTRLDFVGSAALDNAKADGKPVNLRIQPQVSKPVLLDLNVQKKITNKQPVIELVLAPSAARDNAKTLAEWSGNPREMPLQVKILADKAEIEIESNGKPAEFRFTMDSIPAMPSLELMTAEVKTPGDDGAFPQEIALQLPKPKAGETYQGQGELGVSGGVSIALVNSYGESIGLTHRFEEVGSYYMYYIHRMDQGKVGTFRGKRWLQDVDSFRLKLTYGVRPGAKEKGECDVPKMVKIKKGG